VARARGGGGLGTDFECDGGLIPVVSTLSFGGGNTQGPIDVAAALLATPGYKGDFDSETFMVQSVAGTISRQWRQGVQ
jgi:DNA (cytosine-5)-methyltransferase 1